MNNFYTPEEVYCYNYLKVRGLLEPNKMQELDIVIEKGIPSFMLKKSPINDMTYFHKIACALRELWPPGDKLPNIPWRESIGNLTQRLKHLWELRDLPIIPVEMCVAVAQRYLSNYEENAKYMQTLKYFVLKQKSLIDSNGVKKHISESKFADMLEGKADEDAVQNEWEQLLNNASMGEGILI